MALIDRHYLARPYYGSRGRRMAAWLATQARTSKPQAGAAPDAAAGTGGEILWSPAPTASSPHTHHPRALVGQSLLLVNCLTIICDYANLTRLLTQLFKLNTITNSRYSYREISA